MLNIELIYHFLRLKLTLTINIIFNINVMLYATQDLMSINILIVD
jgi:hypothetical protein